MQAFLVAVVFLGIVFLMEAAKEKYYTHRVLWNMLGVFAAIIILAIIAHFFA